ncbi:uncharacterized protein UHOD_11504 [Ustilago sp. UG-2017b]|nr:uncharacterized protein UHOD_11504 [Ustilago sp. UG-2017b]
MHTARSSMSMVSMEAALSMEVALRPCLLPVPARPLASCSNIPKPAMVVFFRALVPVLLPYEPTASMLPVYLVSRTGPTVGNDDEGEIERRGRGDYQTSEGVDERVD